MNTRSGGCRRSSELVLALVAAHTLTSESEFVGDGVLGDTALPRLGDAPTQLKPRLCDSSQRSQVSVAGNKDIAHQVGHLSIMTCALAYSIVACRLLPSQ
jgi:hypothetical protein